jgi:rfaE bifunctional protein kinase chain/domain
MTSIRRMLDRFARVRVLVVGDLMLDQFIWGRVERISPEAPVPVVQVIDESFRLGGAANVIHNVRALGAPVMACGVVGMDSAGRQLLSLLRGMGVGVGGVIRSQGLETTQKTRIVAHQQQVVRLDRDQRSPRLATTTARLTRFLTRHAGRFDVVLVSDYGKGVVTEQGLRALEQAKARARFCLVIDPKRRNFEHYRRPSLITPNLAEASQASGIEIHDESSLRAAGERLLERWAADALLITRADQGMTLFKRDGKVRHFPTVARRVYDVTGAGDTVVATCALALGAGASPEEAAVLANHAAGIVVGEVGTATVSRRSLRAELMRVAGESELRRTDKVSS